MTATHVYTEGQILAMLHLANVSGMRAEHAMLEEQSVYLDPPDAKGDIAPPRREGGMPPTFRIPSRRASRG